MAKRRVITFKLEEEMQSKLLRANMKTVEDVLHCSILQLMMLLKLSAAETEQLILQLSSACVPHCYTVIVTNHVTSRVSEDEADEARASDDKDDGDRRRATFIGPALGNTWTHFVNERVILQFSDEEREFIIAKSPVAPLAVKSFRVTGAGIEFFGELRYTFSGMDPSKPRITDRTSFSSIQLRLK